MNRQTFYTAEQLRSFDLATLQKHALAAIGGLAVSLLGSTSTLASGLAATQSSPPDLTVNLAQGWILQQAAFDATSWGTLPLDSTFIEQIGFAAAEPLPLSTGGLSAGQSQWVLIQAQFAQVDQVAPGDPTSGLLYYYNSANPSQPFQGPNNSGNPQNTERAATIAIAALGGTPAATGSQVPPNPTSGWVPLYLISLTFGQTTINNGQILVAGPSVGLNVPGNYPQAPFIRGLLTANPADSFSHHLGIAGHAPKVNLATEVQGTLSSANIPAINVTSPASSFFGLHGTSAGSVKTAAWTCTQAIAYVALGGPSYIGSALSLGFNGAGNGANGMAGAQSFPAAAQLDVYAIYNPTGDTWRTLGNAISAVGAPLCPVAMPAGYTASILIGSFITAGSNFGSFSQTGNFVGVQSAQVVNSRTVSGLTATSCATVCPVNTKSISGYMNTTGSDTSGALSDAAGNGAQQFASGTGGVISDCYNGVPVLNQIFYTTVTGSNALNVFVSGYMF